MPRSGAQVSAALWADSVHELQPQGPSSAPSLLVQSSYGHGEGGVCWDAGREVTARRPEALAHEEQEDEEPFPFDPDEAELVPGREHERKVRPLPAAGMKGCTIPSLPQLTPSCVLWARRCVVNLYTALMVEQCAGTFSNAGCAPWPRSLLLLDEHTSGAGDAPVQAPPLCMEMLWAMPRHGLLQAHEARLHGKGAGGTSAACLDLKICVPLRRGSRPGLMRSVPFPAGGTMLTWVCATMATQARSEAMALRGRVYQPHVWSRTTVFVCYDP